jgi:hypothetical protein
MANTNFVVQNGLTVGPLTIFAGNGDIISTGNLTVGTFISNTTQETFTANVVETNRITSSTLSVTNTAGLTIGGITAATISDAQSFAIALS